LAQCYPVYSEDKASRSLNGGKGKMTSPSVRGSNVFVSSLRSSEREELTFGREIRGGSCREKETQKRRDRDREVQQ
jgi:hypothetical protein